ncbi:MAG: hypothetical protein EPO02_09790 [Nitrospirae bacterium]|nr:MAG: hypothetical protein EPO02_09790 [Nitrospirota bacterium]
MHGKDYYVALALAMVAGFAGGCMSGHLAAPEPVVAQEAPQRARFVDAEMFRIFDQSGKLRAALGTAPDGSVGLAMVGKDGVLRAKFGVEVSGDAVLDLKDEAAQSHATVFVTAAGNPRVVLLDRNRVGGALLGEGNIPLGDLIVEERPAGSLILLNKDGRVVWRTP